MGCTSMGLWYKSVNGHVTRGGWESNLHTVVLFCCFDLASQSRSVLEGRQWLQLLC